MLIASTLAGTALILIALFDIFMALFHAAGRAHLGRLVTRCVWRVSHLIARKHPGVLNIAGAYCIASVILVWTFTIVLGFTLVYWPHINTWFTEASEIRTSGPLGFDEALNVSLGSLITLGGDLIPKHQLIRFIMGLQAVIGFGLLTASVSWLLSIYPALERRRLLAHQLTLLHHAESETGIMLDQLPSSEAMTLFSTLSLALSQVRIDHAQFPIVYYFRFPDKHTSLAGILPYIARRAEQASHREDSPSVRLAATSLGGAVDDFLDLLAKAFLHLGENDKSQILRAYAKEHDAELVDFSSASKATSEQQQRSHT